MRKGSDISDKRGRPEHINKAKVSGVEAYLLPGQENLSSRLAIPSLLDDNNMQNAPTSAWYALHHVTEGDDKWNDCILAWGLNITISDMKAMKENLTRVAVGSAHGASLMPVTRSPSDTSKMNQHNAACIFNEWYDLFDTLYHKLEPSFSGVCVPRFWRESAIAALSRRCLSGHGEILAMHARLPRLIQVEPDSKHKPEIERMDSLAGTIGDIPPRRPRLNFDCIDRIFTWSGLKIKTMKAIARVLDFDKSEIDCLITRRCSPLPLLAELVPDPQILLGMMHDCDVILSGSHAMNFFWPSASSADSIWEFKTHPHVLHWLKFAVYLFSVGVEWELPVKTNEQLVEGEESESDGEQFQYCPSSGQAIYGTLKRRGSVHRIELAAHAEYPHQQSSIQNMLRLHSSITQCFISGFGAACLYSQSSTSGVSFMWNVRDLDNAQTSEGAQGAVEELQRNGVKYGFSDLHLRLRPDRIPRSRWRDLGDKGALCVPFEHYVLKEKLSKAQLDFQLLGKIAWLEGCHELREVEHGDGDFWDPLLEDRWAERAIMSEEALTEAPLFETMIGRLECLDCRLSGRTLCKTHKFSIRESLLAELLFFCLGKIECRRVSWDFLQLPFRWRECWEYPYI